MSQKNNTYIWLQQIKVAKGNCYTTFIGFSRFITNNLVLLYKYECILETVTYVIIVLYCRQKSKRSLNT